MASSQPQPQQSWSVMSKYHSRWYWSIEANGLYGRNGFSRRYWFLPLPAMLINISRSQSRQYSGDAAHLQDFILIKTTRKWRLSMLAGRYDFRLFIYPTQNIAIPPAWLSALPLIYQTQASGRYAAADTASPGYNTIFIVLSAATASTVVIADVKMRVELCCVYFLAVSYHLFHARWGEVAAAAHKARSLSICHFYIFRRFHLFSHDEFWLLMFWAFAHFSTAAAEPMTRRLDWCAAPNTVI